jgi:AcrR family transcriptional regulator
MSPQAPGRTARHERAEHILDVAGDLLLRWGYQRVTMEDIAEKADVGKGTIYLHWKNREALFLAVMQREMAASADDLVRAMTADPETVVLHRLTQLHVGNILSRPLLRALFTTDPEVLGKLAVKLQEHQDPRHGELFNEYLRLLADNGLLRDDRSVEELSYTYRAILHGFLLAGSPEPADRADLLSDLVARALETSPAPPAEVLLKVAPRAIELITETAEVDRAKVRRAYE